MNSSKLARRRAAQALAPLSIAILALAGCSSSDDSSGSSTSAAAGGSAKYAAVIKGLDNPFFQAMESGIEDTAKDAGIDVNVQAATDIADTTGQADKLSTVVGQGYQCLIVNPISGSNLVQSLAQAKDIPVVNIDSPIDADAADAASIDVATYIGTDNKAAGGKAGTFLSEQLDAGAKVAVIGGISGDVTSAARIDGFKAEAGDLDVVTEQAADWKREVALTKATDVLAANPDVKAFFAANDDMGLGIVKAIENSNMAGKVLVVSVDGNQDALQSVQDGGLTATVAQYPYAIGQLGVQACQVVVGGGDLPKNVESPTALVT